MPGRFIKLKLLRHYCLLGSLIFAPYTQATTDTPLDKELRDLLKAAIVSTDSFVDRFEAEVWLVDMSRRLKSRVPDTRKRLDMLKQIHYEATRAKLYPELVLAVIDVESNFNRYAISKAGAMGLMQVMPFWLKEIGKPGDNLFDLKTNLRMGCTILRFYLDKEKGDLTQALARYNGSKGSYRYTNKVYKVLDKRWRKR
ncbi:MAG: lytic transglycosylase domain-containing protein [Gammaproteobacteria bacterium]|nr:lytic transglycosylase domain-containing protein [Gammaproteobacteria bacterium]